ncbi:MAG TPA: MBL fold metallo-hydrolase [Labilithrix sp.]|nr:MBL fold metallo-hydrolase [Labilithrix sp.]
MSDENEDWGQLYVTRRCCGGGTCRNFAPELFGEVIPTSQEASCPAPLPGSYEEGAFTGVLRQPRSKEEYLAARAAAAACGFGAIRLKRPPRLPGSDEAAPVWTEWPRRLEDNVWVIGQPSTRNYGALAYFIELPGGGILVDVPKPSEQLFRWLEARGGVRWLFLSHRDHVQHHAEFAARFPNCKRVIGSADVNRRQNAWADATDAVEIQIDCGRGPATIDGKAIAPERFPDEELVVITQSGHPPGGLCLLYRGRFFFTGDHLAYSRREGHFIAHRLQCWEGWMRLTASVRELLAWADAGWLALQWLLPGHGEWRRLDGESCPKKTADEFRRAVAWMDRQPPGNVPLFRWIPFVMSRAKPRGRFARLVMAIGGEERDAWLLPRASRQYLTDYRESQSSVARRRFIAFAVGAIAMLCGVVWLATRAFE